ncbi:MAG: hypothetical protein ACJ74C_09650 [Gaiellaceae bacterium]
MAESWVPSLHVCERDGGCRLMLSGLTHGDGCTLLEAADDLVARLLDMATVVRTCSFGFSRELPPPDARLLDFLWEVGERAARGEDVRELAIGPVALSDA